LAASPRQSDEKGDDVSEQAIQERYVELLRRSGETHSLAAGDAIFAEGDVADRMYIVDSGNVSLQVGGQTVENVGPGGIFGEMALIDRAPRSASAVAETDAAVISIDKRRFWFLVQETPYFAETVMRVMAGRIRNMNQSLT
jgi:CRP-like cAMP-binding protein